MQNFQQIKTHLRSHKANCAKITDRTRASVALLLRNPESPEVFFIRRAPHPLDPWSGDIGFPGGRIDQEDNSAFAAAIRETMEETGIHLEKNQLLGRIDDVIGQHLPIIVSCFVFLVSGEEQLNCNHEVDESFWLPISYLTCATSHTETPVQFESSKLIRPAIKMPKDHLPVLWGITFRLIQNFCTISNIPFPQRDIIPLP